MLGGRRKMPQETRTNSRSEGQLSRFRVFDSLSLMFATPDGTGVSRGGVAQRRGRNFAGLDQRPMVNQAVPFLFLIKLTLGAPKWSWPMSSAVDVLSS
jgi:hypothetical protein